ncbi:MAG TPA: hypothetical protein VLB00_00285 [Gemmatimonadales bacterium]|nr:hypothetical protein [Gemmatimonadales bacterium]
MAHRDSLVPVHTRQELENARTKGQVIGWLQGAGAVLLLGVILKFVGWIPLVVVGAVVGYLILRALFGRSAK